MKVTEYLDAINKKLILTYYPNQDGRWCARFDGAEIMERSMLTSAHGNGKSMEGAIRDYLDQVCGTRIVFGAMRDNRWETTVPKSLDI